MSLFYNVQEHRLRTLWRLLLFALFFYLGSFLTSGVVVAGMLSIAGGTLPPGALQNPEQMSQIGAGILSEHPWLLVAYMVATLLVVSLVLAVMARFVDHRPFRDYGFHLNGVWWRDFAMGLLIGALPMALVFLVEWALGWVRVESFFFSGNAQPFLVGVLMGAVAYVCVGFYEEMVSRGYLLRNLAEGLRRPRWGARGAVLLAWVLSSAFFGLMHGANAHMSWLSLASLVLAGLSLGLGVLLTGELAIPIGLHISWNFFEGMVFGFPVSGGAPPVSFLALQQGGPALWTGAAFGPEGGLLGIIATLLEMGLVVWWVRRKQGKLAVQGALAEYTPAAARRAV